MPFIDHRDMLLGLCSSSNPYRLKGNRYSLKYIPKALFAYYTKYLKGTVSHKIIFDKF